MREWFRIEAAAKGKGGGEILIFSHIGKRWSQDTEAVEAKAFVEGLQAMVSAGPGDITIRINSPGGDVGAGMTIYNALRAVKNRVVCRVEGYAYSMASVIALAGRETQMADVGQFMVHNPTTMAWGGQKEMERAIAALKTARATLIKAYSKKTGKSDAEIEALMDETTFMTAEEAKEFGFVDSILDGDEIMEGAVAACFDASAWAAYYQGVGELPRGEEAPEETNEEGGGGVPETDGAETPEKERVMPKLTAKEIREACPGASAEFVLGQVEACESDENRGIEHVLKAHNAELATQVQMANATAAAAQQAAEAAQNRQTTATAPGVAPVGADGGNDEPMADPITAWEDAVAAGEARKLTHAQAIRAVVVGKPELHKAYLVAHNAQHGRVI
jgi:ATP-dependent Clp endopeptidase proteolytic subunit ClpP